MTKKIPALSELDRLVFHSDAADTLSATEEDGKRYVSGVIVRFGELANNGMLWRFQPGSLTWTSQLSNIKLLDQHESRRTANLLGKTVEIVQHKDHIWAKYQVASEGVSAEADRAYALAEDGILDGFSIGMKDIDFDQIDFEEDPKTGRTVIVMGQGAAAIRETSLVNIPAFENARVTEVLAALSAASTNAPETNSGTEGETMGNSTATTETAAETPTPAPLALPADFTASLASAIREGNQPLVDQLTTNLAANPQGLPEGAAAAPAPGDGTTKERPVYTFANERGPEHSFIRDMLRTSRFTTSEPDADAADRVRKFTGQVSDGTVDFAQTVANLQPLVPTVPKQSLYQDQLAYETPLYDAVTKGTVTDVSPFVFPKWVSSANLTGDHTENTHPTVGTVTLTTQTVTPTPLSGAYAASREVFDAATPQLDRIVGRAMLLDYEEKRELAIEAYLDALTATTLFLGAVQASVGTGDVYGAKIAEVFGKKQFDRGGQRFNRAVHGQTGFLALLASVDDTGRPLYPRLGATNANGTTNTNGNQLALDILGHPQVGAWSVDAGDGWIFNSESVFCLTSPLKFFRFEEKAGPESIELALFGYKAIFTTRPTDIAKLTYSAT